MANDDRTERDPRGALLVVQSMIDISADRLDGLRTQCATSAELTQQEIRTLEVCVPFPAQYTPVLPLPPSDIGPIFNPYSQPFIVFITLT